MTGPLFVRQFPAAEAVALVGVPYPLRGEVLNGGRYGDVAVVLFADEVPASIASAHFHTDRKNAWSPYVNWVTAWTRPKFRRRGYARHLSTVIRMRAVLEGCRRLRSAVGSRDGLELHRACGDLFWGRTESGMILVDTPLVPSRFPTSTPISVRGVTDRTEPLSWAEVLDLARWPLAYDEGGAQDGRALPLELNL